MSREIFKTIGERDPIPKGMMVIGYSMPDVDTTMGTAAQLGKIVCAEENVAREFLNLMRGLTDGNCPWGHRVILVKSIDNLEDVLKT